MGVWIEFKRLKLHITEPEVIIHKVENSRFICRVKGRATELYLQGATEFIGRELLIKVDQNVTFYPFRIAEQIVRPDHAVHEFIDVTLHALKYLPVRTLYLLGRYLDIAVKLL